MALERLEALSSLQTTDGLVISQKVVSSAVDGKISTFYFSYLIDNKRKVKISNDVRCYLKNLAIDDIVIKVLEYSLTMDSNSLNTD